MTDVRVPGAFASVLAYGFEDEMAVEEPLEIRVDGSRSRAITTRTPGEDEELALGVPARRGSDRGGESRPAPQPALAGDTIDVAGPLVRCSPRLRSFFTSSSCGVCGKRAPEEVAVHAPRVSAERCWTGWAPCKTPAPSAERRR
jgi:FdhD protein